MNTKNYLTSRKKIIDRALANYIPNPSSCPHEIYRAIRYSLFPGGKRFRAILVIASAEALGSKPQQVLPTACAIEFIHTYSLIHDDLPAIDNDDYRRGKPSVHRKFGEAIAILTGDALLTQSFSIAALNAKKKNVSTEMTIRIIGELANAIGTSGMIGGQVMDIRKKKKFTRKEILYIHVQKTAALITASVRSGAILAGANPADLKNLTCYGENIGLAFQIADDIHDACRKKEKTNFAGIAGEKLSRIKIRQLICEAKKKTEKLGEKGNILRTIAEMIEKSV